MLKIKIIDMSKENKDPRSTGVTIDEAMDFVCEKIKELSDEIDKSTGKKRKRLVKQRDLILDSMSQVNPNADEGLIGMGSLD